MMRLTNPQFPHFLQKADVLRRSGSLCDAVIAVKNHTFHAHRLVLACASTTLAQQLSREQQCTLQLLSPYTFQLVLDFIYSQTLDVSQDDLQLLLRAAQILQMETLEEQCRKQINTLQHSHHRKEKKGITEEKQVVTETNQKEDNLQDLKHAPENMKDCKESLDCESEKNPQSPKKVRPSPTTTQSNRDSVITSSSFSSPWTIPANMWNSVDTLRQIAHNYSTLMSAHSVQSPNQAITCPFTVSSRHMFPFLPSSFQRPVQSSVMAYSRLHPHFSPYTGPTRVGNIIRQGLLKRRKQKTEATAPQPSYMDVAQTDRGKSQNCQYCATRLLSDPASQQSTKTGCRSCGRAVSHQQEHRLDKPYQCKHCSKKFSLKHQLDTHHRVHTGEKPFECRLCGQRSRDYSAMIKHLRTHGGAAPYQCTVCLEYCSSLVAMQRHVKSHSVQDFPSDWSISSTYLYRSHI